MTINSMYPKTAIKILIVIATLAALVLVFVYIKEQSNRELEEARRIDALNQQIYDAYPKKVSQEAEEAKRKAEEAKRIKEEEARQQALEQEVSSLIAEGTKDDGAISSATRQRVADIINAEAQRIEENKTPQELAEEQAARQERRRVMEEVNQPIE